MLKKILIGLAILLVLLLTSAIVLPFIFKDKIIQKVKEEANNNLNAKVDFGEFDLTLFKSFPDFTLTINNVKVDGVNEFAGITLADIGQFTFTIDIKSVLGGGQIKIKRFKLVEPKIHAVVTKDGKANWDIAKPSETPEAAPAAAETPEAAGEFKMSLKEYALENADIIYDDSSFNMFCKIENLNHGGNGDFTQDIFILNTKTTADRLTFIYEDIPYFNKVKTDIKCDIEMDMPNFKFTFKENEFQLNQLFLGMDGWLAMPKEDIDMDIKFFAKQTEFKNILSLVPAVYAKDFETVKTSGKLALDGFAKGTYNEKTIPGFGLNLSVADARFQYPDLPKSVENIQVKVSVSNPGGDADKTVVDIQKFHIEMASNPVDVRMKISTPVSDANIDGEIKAQVNLDNLKEVIPMAEGESYSGSITSDITLKGRISAIEKEKYEEFTAKGTLILLGMNYKSKEVPYGMKIDKAYLNFSPQFVELSSFACNIGKSDINASGKIENFLAYYFRDEALRGSFDMNSSLMDLNEFMAEDTASTANAAAAPADTAPMSVIEVPSNIDFRLTTAIGKLIYDNMEMTGVSGALAIKDREIDLSQLRMNTLDGTLVVDGKYGTRNPKQPSVNFALDITKFDLQKTFNTFNTMQKLAPVAESAKGKFSTKMNFSCLLDEKMEPLMNTLNGGGALLTHGVSIEQTKGALAKLADAMKMEQYKKLYLDNVSISFSFKDGKVEIAPFDLKIQNSTANISGWSSFDQAISYKMKMDVPFSEINVAANPAVSSLLALAGGAAPASVKADVLITGTVTDPQVKVDFSEMAGDAASSVKDMAKEELEKQKAELEKKAKEEAEKLKQQGLQEVDKAKKEAEEKARQEAERVKKEAEEKARQEAEKAKKEAEQKAKDAAKDKVKDLFKKPK